MSTIATVSIVIVIIIYINNLMIIIMIIVIEFNGMAFLSREAQNDREDTHIQRKCGGAAFYDRAPCNNWMCA